MLKQVRYVTAFCTLHFTSFTFCRMPLHITTIAMIAVKMPLCYYSWSISFHLAWYFEHSKSWISSVSYWWESDGWDFLDLRITCFSTVTLSTIEMPLVIPLLTIMIGSCWACSVRGEYHPRTYHVVAYRPFTYPTSQQLIPRELFLPTSRLWTKYPTNKSSNGWPTLFRPESELW